MVAAATARGQNFCSTELRQLVKSWVNVSGCPIVGNAQKNQSFWDRVAVDYNRNRPKGTQERGSRSLESKWGDIKHDVAKFSGAYSNVDELRISGSSAEDTLARAKELYVQKHLKGKAFVFEDCWNLLKDCPKWAQCVDDMATKAASKGNKKRKGTLTTQETEVQVPGSPTEEVNPTPDRSSQPSESNNLGNDESINWQARPIGNKSAKKARQDECSFRIAALASKSIAATNERRTTVLEKHIIHSLFSQRANEVDEEVQEYFRRNCMVEMRILKKQLNQIEATEPLHEMPPPSTPNAVYVEVLEIHSSPVATGAGPAQFHGDGDGIANVQGDGDGNGVPDLASDFANQENNDASFS